MGGVAIMYITEVADFAVSKAKWNLHIALFLGWVLGLKLLFQEWKNDWLFASSKSWLVISLKQINAYLYRINTWTENLKTIVSLQLFYVTYKFY